MTKRTELEITWKHGLTYKISVEPRLVKSTLKHYSRIPYIKHVKQDGEVVAYKDKERLY